MDDAGDLPTVPLSGFAVHYRGRHRPQDAYFWLRWPDEPAPSGAVPPGWLLEVAADELETQGHRDAAEAMRGAAAALDDLDRRAAREAVRLARVRPGSPP